MNSTTGNLPTGSDVGDGRTVLFSLLSRADATPQRERSRADGHVLDCNGDVVSDPAANPGALAIEPDPNLAFEHWGSYWRKVHGPRFTYPEDADDAATLARLARYDQIHRVAPGPSSLDAMPYRPPLDADGRLFDTVIGHVPAYRRPSWDGVAFLQFDGLSDLEAVLGSERVRRKIGPEDKAAFRDLAPLLARQHVVVAGDGREAIIVVRTHHRRAGLDRADFQQVWRERIAALVLADPDAQALVRRYVQLHNIGPVDPGDPMFHPTATAIDGVSLMSFATMRDAETFLLSDGQAATVAAEREIEDAGLGEFWTGVVFTVVDRSGA